MGEFEGRIEGHRDGHGFVIPDNGDPAIYLAPQEMRSVLPVSYTHLTLPTNREV